MNVIDKLKQGLEQQAFDRYSAELDGIKEKINAWNEVRDRYGRLDNCIESPPAPQVARVAVMGADPVQYAYCGLLYVYNSYYNIVTRETSVRRVMGRHFLGKRVVDGEGISETEDAIITSVHTSKLYRDVDGIIQDGSKLCVFGKVIHEGVHPHIISIHDKDNQFHYNASPHYFTILHYDLHDSLEPKVYVVNAVEIVGFFFRHRQPWLLTTDKRFLHIPSNTFYPTDMEGISLVDDGTYLSVRHHDQVFVSRVVID